ncbi:MAG TPA: 16S rRNA (cytosine(967)-C(5))-methyltransferase RsmB [Cycloclasticus sp.]|nr:16S rRNA (cytosine(967)-C(5))-methyltransferase RsmB [Cycloclasticus sp.]HIL91876.1 16S rRNA (cytosine(967)-C(5))-methyltransferase RsmB [Cycloclasticus sp.]
MTNTKPAQPLASARQTAVSVICSVIQQGKSLTDALNLCDSLDPRDAAFCRELCYGTIRWHDRLNAILNLLLKKPFKAKDTDITVLGLLGLYQIIYLSTPDHAAVSETVNTCSKGKKRWAKNVLNGVLRRFLRERDALEKIVDAQLNQQFSHPSWLVNQLEKDWGAERVADILHANNQYPPMSLRTNQHVGSRDAYMKQLKQTGINASANPFNTVGLTLDSPVNVDKLPNFWQGAVSVQDNAAQLAATLLDINDGQRILDVCAAPGGKTAHILESSPDGISLVAIDIDERRNLRVIENLERLKLNAEVLTVDGLEPDEWFDGKQFQRILLDAPCSATGVIRRHPDIKLLRKSSDIAALVELQNKLLHAIWPLLEKKGVLLYATCSILSAENSQQIADFMRQHTDAKIMSIDADWGQSCEYGQQILPGENNMDGFYYACLTKV